jgi:transposase-like protein
MNRVYPVVKNQEYDRVYDWSAEEKARIVQETYVPEMSVSLVARQHGIAPNQVFTWRRLYAEAIPWVATTGGLNGSDIRD